MMFQRIYKKETRIKCNREYVLWVVGSRFLKNFPWVTHGQIFLLMFEFVTVGNAIDILWIISGLWLYCFVLKCQRNLKRSLMLVVEVEENWIMMDSNSEGSVLVFFFFLFFCHELFKNTLLVHCVDDSNTLLSNIPEGSLLVFFFFLL